MYLKRCKGSSLSTQFSDNEKSNRCWDFRSHVYISTNRFPIRENGREKDEGKTSVMLLDWMMKDSYSELKQTDKQRDECRHWTYEPFLGKLRTGKREWI